MIADVLYFNRWHRRATLTDGAPMPLRDKAVLTVAGLAVVGIVAGVGALMNRNKRPLRGAPVDCEELLQRSRRADRLWQSAVNRLEDNRLPKGATTRSWMARIDALHQKRAVADAAFRLAGC